MGVSTRRGIAATMPASQSGGWNSQPVAQPWGAQPSQPMAQAEVQPAPVSAATATLAPAPMLGQGDSRPNLFSPPQPQPMGAVDPINIPQQAEPLPAQAPPGIAPEWAAPQPQAIPLGIGQGQGPQLAQLGAGRLGMKGGDGFTDPIRSLGGPGKPVGVAPRTRLF